MKQFETIKKVLNYLSSFKMWNQQHRAVNGAVSPSDLILDSERNKNRQSQYALLKNRSARTSIAK